MKTLQVPSLRRFGQKGWKLSLNSVHENVDFKRQADLEIVEVGAAPVVILEAVKEAATDLLVLWLQGEGPGGTQQVDTLMNLAHTMKSLHHHTHQARLGSPSLPPEYVLDHAVTGPQTIIGNAPLQAFLRQLFVDAAAMPREIPARFARVLVESKVFALVESQYNTAKGCAFRAIGLETVCVRHCCYRLPMVAQLEVPGCHTF
ncbi:hypothetical protein [Phaeobacter sp. SYSU ZJ3003]|uniref:hypothetical protein n=1 Tax=Phaeobacter sp. SYSU ZJ3003 TaxID=2109330 RepID=UPI00351C1E17